ncbi:E3 ubiquitin-protein ligase PRT1-like protein [Corchorus olitorius]|uniref:E3 ubiquitin-protein ligase PRT1-like protein n=1 Tax=Corchorus olitorius TaxID=93759 RepID=A0A1R3KTK5_9ROSI|nr:E3 ubiquitin-protein ligase PRT1-like protein [Corchorus olitorius]
MAAYFLAPDLLYKPIVLRICQVLHFLLLKLYPTTYKKREHQILEEEKRTGYFSPELNSHECELHGDGEFDYCGSPTNSTAMCFRPSTYPDSTRNDKLCNTTEQNCDEDLNQIKPVSGLEKEQISVADLLCTACKQLLFRPVVLNCGHGKV